MTDLITRVRAAMELVAQMDAAWAAPKAKDNDEADEQIAAYCSTHSDVVNAALALIRDPGLLADLEEVERLREWNRILARLSEESDAKAEAAEADAVKSENLAAAAIEARMKAEAKLAAAEIEAALWHKHQPAIQAANAILDTARPVLLNTIRIEDASKE